MRITSKGQVTISQAVREQAGLHPNREVEFEVRDNGDVVIHLATPVPRVTVRQALEQVRGSANASAFKGMGTDEFMAFFARMSAPNHVFANALAADGTGWNR